MTVRSRLHVVCVRARVYVYLPPCKERHAANGEWKRFVAEGGSKGGSGCERVLSVVGSQGGTESDRSAGGSQSAADLMYVRFESRKSPYEACEALAPFFVTEFLF